MQKEKRKTQRMLAVFSSFSLLLLVYKLRYMLFYKHITGTRIALHAAFLTLNKCANSVTFYFINRTSA